MLVSSANAQRGDRARGGTACGVGCVDWGAPPAMSKEHHSLGLPVKDNAHTRPMRLEDIPEVVSLHMVAFPESRSSRLGRGFVGAMYNWFVVNQPELAVIYEDDDGIHGFLTGAVGGYGRQVFRSAWTKVAMAFAFRPWLLFRPGMLSAWRSYLLAFRRRPPAADTTHSAETKSASVASIAVSEPARGRGIGVILISAFEKGALALGASRTRLSVEYENSAARSCYEHAGWQMTESSPAHGCLFEKQLS